MSPTATTSAGSPTASPGIRAFDPQPKGEQYVERIRILQSDIDTFNLEAELRQRSRVWLVREYLHEIAAKLRLEHAKNPELQKKSAAARNSIKATVTTATTSPVVRSRSAVKKASR